MVDLPKIVLPKDESQKRALEAKLAEYEERLENMREKEKFMHPQLFAMTYNHPVYKHAILQALLEKGELDTRVFALEMQRRHEGFFNESNFYDAAMVINDYCQTGGHNVHGGTGLATTRIN